MRSSGSRAIRENRPNGLHVSKRPQRFAASPVPLSRPLRLRCETAGILAKGRGLPVSDRLGSTSATFGAAGYRAWARSYASIHIPARLPVRSGPTAADARELATSRMTVRTVDGCQPLAQDLVGTARLTSLPDTISSSHRSVPNKFQHKSRRHLRHGGQAAQSPYPSFKLPRGPLFQRPGLPKNRSRLRPGGFIRGAAGMMVCWVRRRPGSDGGAFQRA